MVLSHDGLGSVTNLTNSTASTSETYAYDAFGKPSVTSTLGNRFMFTGREYDSETGLYYYRARHYAPEMGRFLQRDPIGYTAGINLYTYCNNNVINLRDPYGLRAEIGHRQVFGPGYHTVIIIQPDDQNAFAYNRHFYRTTTGEWEATLSANPNWKPTWSSPFGTLTATPNIIGDRPERLHDIQRINDPFGRSDTQLIQDIFASAEHYKNNLPYDPTPWSFDPYYNSNSYVYGMLEGAGITDIPNLPWWEPGADKSIKKKK